MNAGRWTYTSATSAGLLERFVILDIGKIGFIKEDFSFQHDCDN
jgi:hypothetical protein